MSNQNSDVLRTAKALGLNISKVCENCLREAIKRLQGYTQQTETNEGYIDARQGVSSASMVGRAGFEPATFCTSSRCPNRARLPALAVCLDLRLILGFSELALVCVRFRHNRVSSCV